MSLEDRMDRVEEALSRLAEAQAGAEARLGRLEAAITSLAEEQRQLTLAQRHLGRPFPSITSWSSTRFVDAIGGPINGPRSI